MRGRAPAGANDEVQLSKAACGTGYSKRRARVRTGCARLRQLFSCRCCARVHSAPVTGPGGQPGNDSDSSAAGSHAARQLFGQATPEPATTTLRPAAPRRRPSLPQPAAKKIRQTS